MPKRRSLTVSIVLASAGTLCVFLSAIVSATSGEGEWFQRSGSLCVLFFVLLEIHEVHLKKPKPSSDLFSNNLPQLLHQTVPRVHEWFHRAAWIGIVVGTLIWGYGDLVFRSSEKAG